MCLSDKAFWSSNNKNNTIVQMPEINQNAKYKDLRRRYPLFTFEGFSYRIQGSFLHLEFHFILGQEYEFFPKHEINIANYSLKEVSPDALNCLVFHIGMVELISYWKAACPPVVRIKPFRLTSDQQEWWKKLYFNGLGEFFHLNGIEAHSADFMSFTFEEDAAKLPGPFSFELTNELIVPVGGGKDSVVTLSILSNSQRDISGMVINQRDATRRCLQLAGLEHSTLEIQRSIDPQLLELNKQGFLNGHTPFSSVLAFVAALASIITRKKHIALSNEASANEATIPGTGINHQYSKSFEFESDFRWYLKNFISADINYFSFLRPLNELQIASLFAENTSYFKAFRSCNVGSKDDRWCCDCPKCLFTFTMLAPFVEHPNLVAIFGEDLWEKESLITFLEQLSGLTHEKPFECVGTIDEVNAALDFIMQKKTGERLPVLLKHYMDARGSRNNASLENHMHYWNPEHALLDEFKDLLVKSLEKNQL